MGMIYIEVCVSGNMSIDVRVIPPNIVVGSVQGLGENEAACRLINRSHDLRLDMSEHRRLCTYAPLIFLCSSFSHYTCYLMLIKSAICEQ
jgi:hypothetical protein